MQIGIDKYNQWLIFSLETKDFIDQRGHKFIKEFIRDMDEDKYITHKQSNQLIWLMDLTEIRTFITLFKKYFRSDYNRQEIKIL